MSDNQDILKERGEITGFLLCYAGVYCCTAEEVDRQIDEAVSLANQERKGEEE